MKREFVYVRFYTHDGRHAGGQWVQLEVPSSAVREAPIRVEIVDIKTFDVGDE